MFIPKFNHRTDFERSGAPRKGAPQAGQRFALADLPVNTHHVDPDFDGLGALHETDLYVAPGVVAHFGESFNDVALARTGRRVA